MRQVYATLRLILLLLVAAPAWAQEPAHTDASLATDPSEKKRVTLTNGTVLVGVILEETPDTIVLATDDGLQTTIPRANIEEVGPLLERGFSRYDPIPSRLFIAPTGRTMAAGTGRISGYYILPSVAYSPTDRLDLSFASSIPTGGFTLFNFNVKGQLVRGENMAFSVGANAFVPVGSDLDGTGVAGTVYAALTAGSPTNAFTFGVFGVYASDYEDVDFGEGALVLAGYERQVSNSIKLISENYIGVGSGGFGGGSLAGVRFFGDRVAGDLALGFGWGEGGLEISPIPYVGVSYTFGR
ncbi:MAG: hypothetical protein AAFY55_04385 [Bacteroidota bacterium]